MLRPGDSLGPYVLIAKIGNGSSGNVWRAKKREGFGPELAIKILNGNNTSKETFRCEADIWVQLGHRPHPNVMPIIDADIYNGYYVITSYYMPEGSLENWLKNNNGRAPSEQVAIELTLGILEGLAHLHNNNIIHSDLAPKNILLQRGIPHLIDFGVSKIFTSTHSTVEGSSGTPIYMAPEVYNGETSRRSDIWSVGVIFYQLVCGQLPFEGKNGFELWKKISLDPITPLPTNVSKPIQNIIYKALKKDKKDRFQTAEAMIEALKVVVNTPVPSPVPSVPSSVPSKSGLFNYLKYFLLLALIPLIYFPYQYWSQPAPDYSNRGLVYYNQGNLEQALDDFNLALQLDPKDAYAYNNRGKVYSDQRQFNQALADYNKAIQLDPKYAAAYFNRAKLYSDQRQFNQALADFNLAIELDSQNAAAYNGRGKLYSDQSKLEQALDDFNQTIQLDPKFADAYFNRGLVYYNQNQLNQALADYNKAIQLDPKFAYAYNNRGLVYSDQRQFKQALADFNLAIQLDPKNATAYNNRGTLYSDQRQFNQALADYNQALTLDPKYAAAYFNRGILHKKLNNKAEAIANFQKAKSLYKDPKDIQDTIEQLRSLGIVE
jgi:tetratricopeptide (TPR) repeat protein